MSHRPEQLAAEIRSAVQQLLDRGLSDPRISGMITITGVRVTPDHKTAFLNVSVLPAEKQALTFHGLTSAAPHLRRQAGQLVRTRQMPELVFRLDQTLKKQAAVIESISKAAADLEKRIHPSGPAAGPPDARPGSDPAYAEGGPPEDPRS